MIVSRAPVRISLGGGGTDLPSYYSKFGGFLIAAGIDKHIYIAINRCFHERIRLSYSKTEIVDSVEQIEHKLFRESLTMMGIKTQIEIVSMADVPSNCGLGSSATFTVALLNGLHAYNRNYLGLHELAEKACHLEMEICHEPTGKQDQYMATYGGLTCLTFDHDGTVTVEPLKITHEKILELESNIMLFYTGIERSASDILRVQSEKSKQDDTNTLNRLHRIKEIGYETRRAFESGNLDAFGELLREHWDTKKKLSNKISDPFIDECYELALQNGAVGGKIMGAGGGGFFLFYCPKERGKLIHALESKMKLRYMPFRFDSEGAKIISN